ncbi:MAG: O-antigen ligase family protein [Bacteroidota bacterium]
MIKFLKENHSNLFAITNVFILGGIIVAEKAPAILSIAMGSQLLCILLFTQPKSILRNLLSDKGLFIFCFGYLFLLSSFFYSNNYNYLFERLQIKIPLLIAPIIWASAPVFDLKRIRLVVFSFTGIIFITASGIILNYLMHYDAVNQMYLESKIMPGPINHIRFSLLVVFVIYMIFNHLKYNLNFKNTLETKLLATIGILLVIFLHVYSVRSGLLALYGIIGLTLFNHLIHTKNFKQITIAGFCIILIGLISFAVSPTMRNKFVNTKQDVNVYKNNQDPNYNSLSTRMVSYKTGLQIFQSNILWGCGLGDLKDENDALFKSQYPTIETPIIPHNQFLYYLAATGLVGFLVFCFTFISVPLLDQYFRYEYLQVVYLTLILAFQFEAMLETQIGVAVAITLIFTSRHLVKSKKIIV